MRSLSNKHATRQALERGRLATVAGIVFLVTLAFVWASASCSQRELTTEEKLADFDAMVELIRDNYPFLDIKVRSEAYDWLSQVAQFRKDVAETRDNKEFATAMRRALLSLGDRHTEIASKEEVPPQPLAYQVPLPYAYGKSLGKAADYWYRLASPGVNTNGKQPSLNVAYVFGEYVVVEISPELRSACPIEPGSTLIEVDRTPVHDYVESLREIQKLRYDPMRHRVYVPTLPLPDRMIPLTFQDPQNSVRTVEIVGMVSPWRTAYVDPPWYEKNANPLDLDRSLENLHADIINGTAGYLHIRSMVVSSPAYLDKVVSFFKDFARATRDLPGVIIDIRGNTGGDDMIWHTLVKQMSPSELTFQYAFTLRTGEYLSPLWDYLASTYPESILDKKSLPETTPPEIRTYRFTPPILNTVSISPEPNTTSYDGRIFLLVDSRVFSAAENFAAFCKSTHWATVVGDPTGGGGLGIMPCSVALPNSRMVIRFSSSMGLNPDYSSNEESRTEPDYLIQRSHGDLMKHITLLNRGLAPNSLDPIMDAVLRFCLQPYLSVNP